MDELPSKINWKKSAYPITVQNFNGRLQSNLDTEATVNSVTKTGML